LRLAGLVDSALTTIFGRREFLGNANFAATATCDGALIANGDDTWPRKVEPAQGQDLVAGRSIALLESK
jgi:hypothetical protein